MSGFAWVTLATNDSYSLGALVLAHSLRQVGTAHQLAVLVTPGVTNVMRKNLADVFNIVEEVNLFDSKDEANLRLLKRPELGVTFTKLHCWRLTQFEKCVFLDADVLVLVNSDELFERDEFSAAPDVGWPDCFNSGVFVYKPSLETYSKLVDFAVEKGSFDGGDQGLLNAYFCDWAHKDISKHLPFIYNMCSVASYSYMPAFKYYGENVKIVHFIGPAKPWLQYFDTESRQVRPSPDMKHLEDVLQKWWDIFCSVIHPKLSPDMSGLAGAFAQFTLGAKRSPTQDALENHLRRQAWEVGNIDYMGRDSFDNIWSKICQTLTSSSLEEAPVKDGAFSSDTQEVPEVAKDIASKPEDIQTEKPQEASAESVDTPIEPVTATVEEPKKDAVATETVPETIETPKVEEPILTDSAAVITEAVPVSEQIVEPTVTIPADVTKLEETKASDVTPAVPKADDKPQEETLTAQETVVQKEGTLEEGKPVDISLEAETPKEEVPTQEIGVKAEGVIESPKVDDKSNETQQSDTVPTVEKKVETESEAPAVAEQTPKAEEAAPKPEEAAPKVEEAAPKAEEAAPIVSPKEQSIVPPLEETIPPKTEISLDVKTEEVPVISEAAAQVEAKIDTPTAIVAPAESEPEQKVVEEKILPTESPKEEVKEVTQSQEQVQVQKETAEVTSQSSAVSETKPKEQVEIVQKEASTKATTIPETKEPVSQKKESKSVSADIKSETKSEAVPAPVEVQKTSETLPVKTPTPLPKLDTTPQAKEPLKTSPVQTPSPVEVSTPKLDTTPKVEAASKADSASAEAVAEPSSPVPKSDTEPKETKKKVKKVKKVVKKPAAESSDAPAKK